MFQTKFNIYNNNWQIYKNVLRNLQIPTYNKSYIKFILHTRGNAIKYGKDSTTLKNYCQLMKLQTKKIKTSQNILCHSG